MCGPIIGALIGAAASIAGSFMTAQSQANAAQYEADVRKQQLRIENENEKIKSLSETNNRFEQFLFEESQNRAALSASGLQTNVSYEQGIEPRNREVFSRDVARQQYDSRAQIASGKYNIKVAQGEADVNKANAYTTAMADSIGALGSVFAAV